MHVEVDVVKYPREARELLITSDMIYGYTDGIILRCLMDGDNYGYEINRSILKKTDNRFELKEATLYTAFRRLEKDGCISSYWRNDVKSSGPKRRYYSITDKGKQRLTQRLKEWEEIQSLMNILLA